MNDNEASKVCEEVSGKLWVDRYAPRTYTDLLSEEVNVKLFLPEHLQCVNEVIN